MQGIMSVCFGLVALTGQPTFVPVGNDDGVALYARKGGAAVDMMAVGIVEAPPAEVQALLLDYDNYGRINPRLAESRVLSRGPHELVAFQRLKLPVIKDRVYLLRVTWRSQPHRSDIRFALAGKPETGVDTIAMPVLQGHWELESIRDGAATRLVYTVQMALGEGVPNSLVGDGAVRELPMLFKNLRRLVKDHHAALALHH